MQCEAQTDNAPCSIDCATVRGHLAQVLASRYFSSAKRLRLFLTFVVETTLAGGSDGLKEYVIATEVYGRSSDYDPQVDSTVRVEASRLRAKLRDYYAAEGANQPVRIELPKGSYVPAFHRHEVRASPDAAEPLPTFVEPVSRPFSGGPLRAKTTAAAIFGMLAVTTFFAFQANTMRAVPESAKGRQATPDNPALIDKYLRADQLLRQRVLADGWSGTVPRNVVESVALFEEVTRAAPNYAKAWAGLAEAQEWAYELDGQHPKARLEAARAAAERAVKIDPALAEAHSRLSAIYLYSYGDVKRSEQETLLTIQLNPRDVRAQARYVDLLRMQGRLPDALAAVNRALAVDASSARLWTQQALVFYDLDRIAEAMSSADHALELNPGNQMNQVSIAHWIRGLCLQQQGMLQRAEAEFRKGLEFAPQDDRNQPALGYVLGQQGRTQQAQQVLAALKHQHALGKPVSYGIAVVYAGLDNAAESARWLKKSSDEGETSYRFTSLDKRLKSVVARTTVWSGFTS